VFVEGRLRQDKWEDKTTGDKRSKMVVVLEGFQFIDGPRGSGGEGAPGGGAAAGPGHEDNTPPARSAPRANAPASAARPPPPGDNIDEDVPF
jgi:single-strand DNA-binding protein